MPYDPTKPAFGSPDSSAAMRAQLDELIKALPRKCSPTIQRVEPRRSGDADE